MKIENIKFKAKALNSGEWVVGDLLHRITDTCIAVKDMDDIVYYPVDPATVCQFTGLKDCEGNEIWEGDIVKSPYFGKLAIVKWDDSLCGFKCVGDTGNIYYSLRAIVESSGWFVIGNKFDKEK